MNWILRLKLPELQDEDSFSLREDCEFEPSAVALIPLPSATPEEHSVKLMYSLSPVGWSEDATPELISDPLSWVAALGDNDLSFWTGDRRISLEVSDRFSAARRGDPVDGRGSWKASMCWMCIVGVVGSSYRKSVREIDVKNILMKLSSAKEFKQLKIRLSQNSSIILSYRQFNVKRFYAWCIMY